MTVNMVAGPPVPSLAATGPADAALAAWASAALLAGVTLLAARRRIVRSR